MIRPLKEMPYAQATVSIYENGDCKLTSYKTDVIYVIDGYLEITGLYSKTTRRHIKAFMEELGFTYEIAKTLYTQNLKMNVHTSEVVSI